MAHSSNDVGSSHQRELVRCNSCRAVIPASLMRCSYCGQITTGTERAISELDLDLERRGKLSERRSRYQCRLCGKAVPPKTELCVQCETSEKNKVRLLFAIVAFAIIAIIVLLS